MSDARSPGQEAVGQLCFGGLTVVQIFDQLSTITAQRDALLAALQVTTDSLRAIVNGEVIISNKGHKLYTFPDQSACLSEHDPKVIKARSSIEQASAAISLAGGGK